MIAIFVLISAALADDFTIAPWSGASVAVTEQGASVVSSFSSPVVNERTVVDMQAEVPAAVLQGAAAGQYAVSAGWSWHNARSLEVEADKVLFSAIIDEGLTPEAGGLALLQQGAWCHILDLGDTEDLTNTHITQALKKRGKMDTSADEFQALIKKAKDLKEQGAVAEAGNCSTIPAAYSDVIFTPIVALLKDAEAILLERTILANNTAGTLPYQSFVSGAWADLSGAKSTLVRGGLTLDYASTATDGGSGVAFGSNKGGAGGEVFLFFRPGFALKADVAGTVAQAAVEGGDPAFGVDASLGGAWVSHCGSHKL